MMAVVDKNPFEPLDRRNEERRLSTVSIFLYFLVI